MDDERITEEEEDKAIDALLAVLNMLPKESVTIIQLDRYRSMQQAAAEFRELLAEAKAQGEVQVELSELFLHGSVSATLDDLTVMNVPRFASMLAKADAFEVYPRTDGKLQVLFTFHSVLKVIG